MKKDLIFKEFEKEKPRFSTCKIGHYWIINLDFLKVNFVQILKRLLKFLEQQKEEKWKSNKFENPELLNRKF